jgi:uncharacterized protein (DUF302 family)
MEGPNKVVVWQDQEGKVWLAYNSADWWQKTHARHGMKTAKRDVELYARALDGLAMKATQ